MFDSLNRMECKRQKESGNALIYVLIAIALFAALSLTLGRQTDTSEAGALSEEKAELLATQLINYAAQAKSVADQMDFSIRQDAVTSVFDKMVFTRPTDAAFNTAPHENKIFHPDGGGLNPANLVSQVIHEISTDPGAGWYIGRFNNVEWTASTKNDVILVAHQINQQVCANINNKVTGSTAIPAVTGATPAELLIDDAVHTGTNADFNIANCGACENYQSLCVSNLGGTAWSFYNIIGAQ